MGINDPEEGWGEPTSDHPTPFCMRGEGLNVVVYNVMESEEGYYVSEDTYKPKDSIFDTTQEDRLWFVSRVFFGPYPQSDEAFRQRNTLLQIWRQVTDAELELLIQE